MTSCTNPHCFISDGESCPEGNTQLSECPHFNDYDATEEVSSEVDAARVPWSGSALGLSDLNVLAARGRTIVVGVLGPHDSGKTTFLMGNYLNILQGVKIANTTFAGSWTLGAWESLAAWARFNDSFSSPTFPPHTPRSSGRTPGLLHFALKNQYGCLRDIFITDAPGEWFAKWAINANASDAEGARWTALNADVFLILADCEKLSGEQRGNARRNIRQLIERLGPAAKSKPVTLVWAKSDVASKKELSSGIRDRIESSLAEHIPHATQIEVTIKEPCTFSDALTDGVSKAWIPPKAPAIVPPIKNTSPFSAYRGSNADS